jgi:two-component system, LuxR family, response regulator FixJ
MSDELLVHVIDDDDAVRESLDFLLSTAAFAVRTYETATRFLDALPDRASGCVVTDVRMPEMTGIELLKRLGDIQAELPVVVITGQADVPLAVEAMRLGAVDFLEKPVDDDVLLASIRSALRAREIGRSRDSEQRKYVQRVEALSGREREVLEGLLAGHPN